MDKQSTMASSYFQAAMLVGSPSYPNALAWSEENLLAVAAGHLVLIYNPAFLLGPRGVIKLATYKPFPIGVVKREDLLSGCLLPTSLSRDTRPCARSISWSHLGLAPNSGCLLAVCSTEGRVKLYRPPFTEFCAEWVEVADISELLLDHLMRINFREEQSVADHKASGNSSNVQHSVSSKGRRRKRAKAWFAMMDAGTLEDDLINDGMETTNDDTAPPSEELAACTELFSFPCSSLKKGSSVEVFKQNGAQGTWVRGVIKRLKGAKALVTVTNGKQSEWVDLNSEPVCNGSAPDPDAPLPKVRPSMEVGNFLEQVSLLKTRRGEDVLSIGQAVEAWIDERWTEGLFMGFKDCTILVDFSGDDDPVKLDVTSVRLAPSWNSELKSWQVTLFKIEQEDSTWSEVNEMKNKRSKRYGLHRCFSVPKHEEPPKKRKETETSELITSSQLITARQYTSRSAILSSTVVSWSPVLQLLNRSDSDNVDSSPSNYSLLAVGGKSGKVSFWRIQEPQFYSVEPSKASVDVMLIGILQAHNAWITAICWKVVSTDGSNHEVLLVTGSSDGSVKIWLGDAEGMSSPSIINNASFSLLKEVTNVTSVPVSVLSSTAPSGTPGKMLLAIGKGSGSLEVWRCDIFGCKFQAAGSYNAHYQVVTGLVWGFNGCCLYSCSQDNTMRCLIFDGNSLSEGVIPSNSLGPWSSTDFPHVSDSCLGLAIASGNLVLAVARGIDADTSNPMYQSWQKAAVEFFWIGGQQLKVSSDRNQEHGLETIPGFSRNELAWWQSNILWSLKQFEHVDRPLVIWDIIAVLLAFKHSAPTYVEQILCRWFLNWFVGCAKGSSIQNLLYHVSQNLLTMHSRQLQLLNIICRRLILSEDKADIKQHYAVEDEQLNLWVNLLANSERELRGRLVALNYAAVLSKRISATNASIGRHWLPVGVAQMGKWVEINHCKAPDQLKRVAPEVKKLARRLPSSCDYIVEEKCSFCSASVPFESPEDAVCTGMKHDEGVSQGHKLSRCAVSMRVCPITPLWHCVCCKRWVSKLAPQSLFTMSEFPLDIKSLSESSSPVVLSTPLCPYCGILLQRLQPEFLLSPLPV